MRYNFEKIGKRLKFERKKAGLKSQDSLSEKLKDSVGIYPRQRIAKWENGEEVPPMEVLCALSNLYNCDVGYLLCEYDCRTRPIENISRRTGLSESSVDKLFALHRFHDGKMEALNSLIEDNNFEWLLSYIARYQKTIRDYKGTAHEVVEHTMEMISELASNTDDMLSSQSSSARSEAADRLQASDMFWDALEYKIDSCFQEIIHDIRKTTAGS